MLDKPKKSPSPKISIDTTAIETLAQLLKKTDLSDIEYEIDGCRVRVSRQVSGQFTHVLPASAEGTNAVPAATVQAAEKKGTLDLENHPGTVKSPMVGTVYLAPKPGAPSFVSIGAAVKEGQTLAIIEAMKVMNPFKSPKSGKITHIFAEDAHPVEYDQPLFIIE